MVDIFFFRLFVGVVCLFIDAVFYILMSYIVIRVLFFCNGRDYKRSGYIFLD